MTYTIFSYLVGDMSNILAKNDVKKLLKPEVVIYW